jgi:glutaminyl-tRNA synthetase
MGTRKLPFGRELWIEASDFMEDPPKKFFRLGPGREVRLRWAYLVTCTDFVKNDAGEVVEVHCTYDPETRGGSPPDGRRVKGTIHWVSAKHALDAEVRLYEQLLREAEEGETDEDFIARLNPKSLEVIEDAKVEPSLAGIQAGERMQFERTGYFVVDEDSTRERPVFNRTVPLRDSWAKIAKK